MTMTTLSTVRPTVTGSRAVRTAREPPWPLGRAAPISSGQRTDSPIGAPDRELSGSLAAEHRYGAAVAAPHRLGTGEILAGVAVPLTDQNPVHAVARPHRRERQR